jgi:hypothetical protein
MQVVPEDVEKAPVGPHAKSLGPPVEGEADVDGLGH